ncbi:MAG: helix-turn-helix domain-containing protein [Bdellovibrionales bacterium]|nr:helix-turn-helix domain-containing protein [Bdellovibrionales bacterium]
MASGKGKTAAKPASAAKSGGAGKDLGKDNGKSVFCPVEVTLGLLAGKWKVMIIYYLLEGTRRFNHLQRDMHGITHRTLSQQLKEMEQDGLVLRKDYGEIPPRVEYSLSPLGKSLAPVLAAMHLWGERHHKKLNRK